MELIFRFLTQTFYLQLASGKNYHIAMCLFKEYPYSSQVYCSSEAALRSLQFYLTETPPSLLEFSITGPSSE